VEILFILFIVSEIMSESLMIDGSTDENYTIESCTFISMSEDESY